MKKVKRNEIWLHNRELLWSDIQFSDLINTAVKLKIISKFYEGSFYYIKKWVAKDFNFILTFKTD